MALLVVLLAGCSRVLTIDVEESATTVVEGSTLIEDLLGDLGFGAFVSMDITASEELANQGVEPGDITSAVMTSFVLSATDPAGADLSWITSMDLLVAAPDLDEVLVATASDFPEGQAEVAFDTTGVELVDYVVSRSMTVTTDTTARRPPEDTTVEARFVVRVEATVRGALNQARGD